LCNLDVVAGTNERVESVVEVDETRGVDLEGVEIEILFLILELRMESKGLLLYYSYSETLS
jgi:hypothetical protein